MRRPRPLVLTSMGVRGWVDSNSLLIAGHWQYELVMRRGNIRKAVICRFSDLASLAERWGEQARERGLDLARCPVFPPTHWIPYWGKLLDSEQDAEDRVAGILASLRYLLHQNRKAAEADLESLAKAVR